MCKWDENAGRFRKKKYLDENKNPEDENVNWLRARPTQTSLSSPRGQQKTLLALHISCTHPDECKGTGFYNEEMQIKEVNCLSRGAVSPWAGQEDTVTSMGQSPHILGGKGWNMKCLETLSGWQQCRMKALGTTPILPSLHFTFPNCRIALMG